MREFCEYCSEEFEQLFFNFSAPKNNNTRNEYISYVNLLCKYIGKDFLDIGFDDARKYLDYMNSERSNGKLTKKTVCVRLSCYNTLAQHIEEHSDDYKNPFSRLARPEVSHEFDPNRIPTMEELDSLFSEAKKDTQHFLILALASRVGLSATSVLNIHTDNIVRNGEDVYIHFEPKGDFDKDSYVKLPEDVKEVLELYVKSKNIDLASREPLFKNKWGNPLTLKNVDQLVKKIARKCGLEEYTLKDFRNRALLDMANSGVSMEKLSEYTGLKSMRLEKFFLNVGLVSDDCPAELVNYRLIVN